MCKKRMKWALLAMILIAIAVIVPVKLRAIPVSATLTAISGDVQVMLPGGSWQAAKDNMLLPNGTAVKTGAKSSAVVKWSSQNTIKLTPFTNFVVKNIDIDPKTKTVKTDVDLFSGKVKLKAEKLQNPNSSFKVTTPTAVAGVRGTEGDIENTPENTTNVTVRDGIMDVTSQGQTVTATGGEQVSVNSGQPPAPPKKVTNEEIDKCDDNNDCASGRCDNGQCAGESNALKSGACLPEAQACENNGQCCSKSCVDNVCTAMTVAAACIPNGDACTANSECCSQDCGANGRCVGKPLDKVESATGTATVGTTGTATVETATGTTEIECKVSISKPDVTDIALSAASVVVEGTTVPGATCKIGDATVQAKSNGSFSGEVSFSAEGELSIPVECSAQNIECTAQQTVSLSVVGPPELTINSPSEGFTACPYVNISGTVTPGASLIMDGTNLLNDSQLKFDNGMFERVGLFLKDCTKSIEFVAKDQYGQETRVIVNSGATTDAAALGLVIEDVSLTLTPTRVWQNGLTGVKARVVVKSASAFSGALLVNFHDDAGTLYGNSTLMPITGLSGAASDGKYYAQAEMQIQTGPKNPLTVEADIPGGKSAVASVIINSFSCIPSITTMTPGDGIDNDCDGRIGEDPIDGIDNDFDGLIDEDAPANMSTATGCSALTTKDTCFASVGCQWVYTTAGSTAGSCVLVNMVCGDAKDNDRDGKADEESQDGIDNDGDGKVDEDTLCGCNNSDPYADCDGDLVLNGVDCNAFNSAVTITKSDPACAAKCDAVANPSGDCDSDGLSNSQELAIGTNPYNKDTDGDGFTDKYEVESVYDPLNAASKPSSCGTLTTKTTCETDTNCYWNVVTSICSSFYTQVTSTTSTTTCIGGQVKASDGTCMCPSGTVWNSTLLVCEMPTYTRCGGKVFDEAVGACVDTCTGGQVADATTGTCYCPNGTILGPEDYCVSVASCPTANGFVVDTATNSCVCNPASTPYYDELQSKCVATCSGGQVGDAIDGICVCPSGATSMYLDFYAKKCVATVSTTICPAGTAGAGCDYMVGSGDCDADGITNSVEIVNGTEPCVNQTGVQVSDTGVAQKLCPAGTDAEGCDLLSTTKTDCDYDGALNTADECPCMYGSSQNNFCPAAATSCPTGYYLDEFYGSCVTTCPSPRVADTATNKCVCPTGTYLDPDSGACSNGCPTGMVPDATGTCACGSTTPYINPLTGECTASCPAGMSPDTYSNSYCTCPADSYPDAATGGCICYDGSALDLATKTCPVRDECSIAPKAFGCACASTSECDQAVTSFCNSVSGVCEPVSGECNGNSVCDYTETAQSCPADCKCGDGYCDAYELSVNSCTVDCSGSTITTCSNGCSFSVAGGDCDADTVVNSQDSCPCAPGTVEAAGCPVCSELYETCATAADCCDATNVCEMDAALMMMVCKSSSTTATCDNDNICEYYNGETTFSCANDCACNFNDYCDSDENEYWCNDCSAVCGDGFCGFDQGTEDNATCPQDCLCDLDGVCDAGESAGWCVNDCACVESGMPAGGQADCCSGIYDMCTGMCAAAEPTDADADGIPDSCDSCPTEAGSVYNNGCSVQCLTDEQCAGNASGAYCDVCNGFVCVSTRPVNSDNDLLPDSCDMCPTVAGIPDNDGCPTGYCTEDYQCGTYMACDKTNNTCMSCDLTVGDGICCNGEYSTDCGTSSCETYVNSDICAEDPSCKWMVEYCVPVDGCNVVADQATCEGNLSCVWDSTYGLCYTNNGSCIMEGNTCDPGGTTGCCGSNSCTYVSGTGYTCQPDVACESIMDQASCQSSSQCGWNYTDGNCYSNYGDCTTIHLNESDCVNDLLGRCEWDYTNTYCHFTQSGICSQYTDETTCGMDPSCQWDYSYTSCGVAQSVVDCSMLTDEVACSNYGCSWSTETSTCSTGSCLSIGADCTGGGSCCYPYSCVDNGYGVSTCVESTYCGDAACNGGETTMYCPMDCCPALMDEASCSSDVYCSWDTGNSECVSGGAISCSAYTDQASCNNNSSCYHDGVSGCMDFYDSANCGFFSGDSSWCTIHGTYCTWDGTSCNSGGPQCTGYTDETACTADTNCTWLSGDSACVVSGTGCTAYTNQTDCNGNSGCVWESTYCTEFTGEAQCMYFDETNCSSLHGGYCTYTTYCTGINAAECQAITNETDCTNAAGTYGCAWNGTSCDVGVACLSFGADCTSGGMCCDPYVCTDNGYGVSTCAEASYCGDTVCNGVETTETCPNDCCLSYPDKTSCDTDGYCSWNSTESVCYAGGSLTSCSVYADQTTCNADVACVWESTFCESLYGEAQCMYFTDSVTCESHNSVCTYNGTQCLGINAAVCVAITNETDCTNAAVTYGCAWNGTSCDVGMVCVPLGADCTSSGTCCDPYICTDNGYGVSYCTQDSYCGDATCSGTETTITCPSDCCLSYSDETACIADSYCAWDSGTSLCMAPGSGGCSTYTDQSTCNNNGSCYWLGETSVCTDFTDSAYCGFLTGDTMWCGAHNTYCTFNGTECVSLTSGCASYTDQTTCEADVSCNWNALSTQCDQDLADCTGYVYETSCNTDPDCTWNGTSCEATAADCASYADQTSCQNDALCTWTGALCVTTNACTVYGGETGCASDPTCWWDQTNTYCELCPVSTPYPIGCACTSGTECNSGICGSVSGLCEATAASCTSYSDETSCTTGTTCIWSSSISACFDKLSSCSEYMIEYACAADGSCTWSGTSCTDMGTSCSGYTDQSTCETDSACNWFGETSACFEDLASCPEYVDASGCNADTECTWNGTSCEAMAADCASYADQTNCQNDALCTWTGTLCVTSNACTVYGGDTGCTSDPTCWWDQTNAYCELCPVSTPYPIGCACTSGTECNSGICGSVSGICEATAADCASYADQTSCQNDALCTWTGALCVTTNACTAYGGDTGCTSDPTCWWDQTNAYCELCPVSTPYPIGCACTSGTECNSGICGSVSGLCESTVTGCSSYSGQIGCEADSTCNWNATSMMCYDDQAFCSYYSEEYSCLADSVCTWSGSACSDTPACGSYTDETTCTTGTTCIWSATAGTCYDDLADCTGYAIEYACIADGACTWNGTTCETASAGCSSYTSGTTCEADSSCNWSNYDGTCYTDYPSCSVYASQQYPCEADTDCTWTGSTCTDASASCSSYTDETTCTTGTTCIWSASAYMCYDDLASCSEYTIEYSCIADSACTWTGSTCTDASVSCSSYTDQTTCDTDANCNWSTGDSTCYTDYPSCSVYASQQYPCEADTDCTWTGSTCTDASAACSSYTDETTCTTGTTCIWSANAYMCYDDLASCSEYMIEYSCIADVACTWTGSACTDIGASCSSYTDQTTCDTDANCNWGSAMSTCYENLATCVNYTEQYSCIADIDKSCEWDSANSVCVATCASDSECVTGYACATNASPATCVSCSTFDGMQTLCEGHTSKCTWNSGTSTCDSL